MPWDEFCNSYTQNFCEINKTSIWRIFWKKLQKIHLLSLFRVSEWNSNFFNKTIAFTKFLRKKCEREFLHFPLCGVQSITYFGRLKFTRNLKPVFKGWLKILHSGWWLMPPTQLGPQRGRSHSGHKNDPSTGNKHSKHNGLNVKWDGP